MGKMKMIWQAMVDADWKGTQSEYLEWWIRNEAKRIDEKERKNENINNNNTSNTFNKKSTEVKPE
jgi:hypothetical protein